MSIATKCTCGHSVSGICLSRIEQCVNIIKDAPIPAPANAEVFVKSDKKHTGYLLNVLGDKTMQTFVVEKVMLNVTPTINAEPKGNAEVKSAEEVILKYIPKEVLAGMNDYFSKAFMIFDNEMVTKYLKKCMEEYAAQFSSPNKVREIAIGFAEWLNINGWCPSLNNGLWVTVNPKENLSTVQLYEKYLTTL